MPSTNFVQINSNWYPIARTAQTATASGTNNLVAAVAGKKIRLLGLHALVASSFAFRSATGGADQLTIAGTAGNYCLPLNPAGYAETVAGEALVMNGSATDNKVTAFYAVID